MYGSPTGASKPMPYIVQVIDGIETDPPDTVRYLSMGMSPVLPEYLPEPTPLLLRFPTRASAVAMAEGDWKANRDWDLPIPCYIVKREG